MKLRTKIATLFVALLTLFGLTAAPAYAAPRATSSTTITLDPTNAGSLPLQEVARDWSRNTDINVVVKPCTGANCVHLSVATFPCNIGVGEVGSTIVGGCARASSDPQACDVQVRASLEGNIVTYVTKHEVGHCIFWYGGAGWIHLDSTKALMGPEVSSNITEKQTMLTPEDRRFTRTLF